MKVLLSIKPQFVQEIFDGTKKYEYRKIIFKNKNVKTIVIYATKPVGKIVGEFEIDRILVEHPSEIWKKTEKYAGITQAYYDEYFEGREKAYAIQIKSVNEYKYPICPFANNNDFVPPQSFKYLID